MSLTFEQAQARAKSLDGLDNETKLCIYSTFKCTIGAPTSARPGWTDPVGRAKWDAYSERSKVLTDTGAIVSNPATRISSSPVSHKPKPVRTSRNRQGRVRYAHSGALRRNSTRRTSHLHPSFHPLHVSSALISSRRQDLEPHSDSSDPPEIRVFVFD